jgi:exodeoxyribonuclease VII large subunit
MTLDDEHIYTPTELNREVRLHIEIGFPRILLEAEISNLSKPPSGHLYFSLKDQKAQIRCALFRSSASRLSIQPENGMKVLARGRISLYEPRGEFQMIVDNLTDAGEGLLRKQFEDLKKKLDSEGLFDPAFKQAIPIYPMKIAVVTSPGGAAIRDIVHVLERRWPLAHVRIYPASVQGNEAPRELLAALQAANEHGWADTIIIGRGGGSLEDLAAFNDENLARAVFSSGIPVISAVGHETDFSICDFVADLRAPTPSAAAELAAPDQVPLKQAFARFERLLKGRMRNVFESITQRLDHLSHRLQRCHPARQLAEQSQQLERQRSALFRTARQSLLAKVNNLDVLSRRLNLHDPRRKLPELSRRLQEASQALTRLAHFAVQQRRRQLADLLRTLNAVSPLETIARGYAVIRLEPTGQVITSIKQAQPGEHITAQLRDGQLTSLVESINEKTLDKD